LELSKVALRFVGETSEASETAYLLLYSFCDSKDPGVSEEVSWIELIIDG